MEKKRTTVYLEPEMDAHIRQLAKQNRRSITQQINYMLAEYLSASDQEEPHVTRT